MLKPEDIDHRMEKMYEADHKHLYTTDQSIKIVTECYKDSKKIKYKRGIKQSGLFLMTLYITKFDYNNALKISNEIESTVIEYINYKNIAEYHLAKAQCYIETGLLNDGYEEYIKAKNAIEKIENSDEKYYKKSEIYLHLSYYHGQTVEGNEDSIIHYTKKALAEGEKISNNGKLAESGERNDWIVSLNLNLGNCYLKRTPPDINTSRIYYQKARNLYENSETKIHVKNEIQLLSYLSQFYYQDKNYEESVYFGLKSLELQKQENDPYSKQIAYESIAKSYLELGKEEEYQKYMDKYVTLTDSIKVYDKLETSKSLETIVKKKEDDNAKRHNSVLYISEATILIIVSCFLFLWRHRNKKIHSNYLAIIESIKNEKEIKSLYTELASDEKVNTFNIPEETYHKILIKMNRFEKTLDFLKMILH
jgi:tetratricopeptide (TPR) repeat protein